MPPKKKETLELSGNLDIRQAEDLKEAFSGVLEAKHNLTLDFSKADDIDFSVIQLLYSFKNAMEAQNCQLDFIQLNEKIRSRLVLSDFLSLVEES